MVEKKIFIKTCLFYILSVVICCTLVNAEIANIKKGKENYQKAKEFIKKRDADNAIVYLEKAVTQGYSDGTIYGMLGGLYLLKAKESFNLSIKTFEKERDIFKETNDYEMVERVTELIKKTKQQLAKLEKEHK